MARKMTAAFCAVLCALSLPFVSCKKESKTELTVLAAASLTDVCAKLKEAFETQNPSVSLLFSFGGSGALQAQIEAGAGADVFISAASRQMNALVEKGFVSSDSVKELLENQVVLIVSENSSLPVSSFNDLTRNEVKMVAIGEPESVPVGQYTKAICENLGILEQVFSKANFASDVRTVLSWVESQAVDAGVVYATDAATSPKVKIVSRAPEGSCPRVVYPVGIIKSSGNQAAASAFVEFLSSKAAKSVFEKAGFTVLD